jgi:predicted nucleic acid-binding protein
LVSGIKLSRDPDDNVFLGTAIDGQAALSVSGDKTGLLSLGAGEAIPIVSAREGAVWLEL